MNDAATLLGLLRVALRDPADATWSAAEKASLIEQAVADCPQRGLLHDDVTVAIVAGTYHYPLDASVTSVSRLDLVDADGTERGSVPGGLWEVIGDAWTSAELHLSPRVVDDSDGFTAHVIGYGRYDTATNLVPDEHVPYVIAHAKAAAYGAMVSDRARFRNFETSEQPFNISVNELIQLMNDAQLERDRNRARIWRWRKPMPASRS